MMNIVVALPPYCVSSSPVPLADLYFESFSYPVAPIVSSAGAIV